MSEDANRCDVLDRRGARFPNATRSLGFLAAILLGSSCFAEDTVTIAALLTQEAAQQLDQNDSLELPANKIAEELPSPGVTLEPAPISIPASTPVPWLDIRPRSLDAEHQLVRASELPADTSALTAAQSTATWMQCYRADFALSDFIRGASFCHRPLHFEDPYLERYGRPLKCMARCPLAHSSVHMIWKTSLAPVSVALDPPWQRQVSGFREPYWSRLLKR